MKSPLDFGTWMSKMFLVIPSVGHLSVYCASICAYLIISMPTNKCFDGLLVYPVWQALVSF